MPLQLIQPQKPSPTPRDLTPKLPLPQMHLLMFPQITALPKPFPTDLALQRLFPRVHPRMHQQRRGRGECLGTERAGVGTGVGMQAGVLV